METLHQLTSQISELDKEIIKLQNNIKSLNGQIVSQISESDKEIIKLQNEIKSLNDQLTKLDADKTSTCANKIDSVNTIKQSEPIQNFHYRTNNYSDSKIKTHQQPKPKIHLEDLKIDFIAKLCDEKRISRHGVLYRKNDMITLLNKHGIYHV